MSDQNLPMFFVVDSPEARARAVAYVKNLRGSPLMSVEVKRHKKSRTQAQNRLMWMWYGVICDATGNEPEDLHEQMKVRVLGVEKKVILGQAIIVPRSTKDLDTQGMTNFLEAIEALAVELEVALPIPDETDYAMHRERR